jgi:hypothetical protein
MLLATLIPFRFRFYIVGFPRPGESRALAAMDGILSQLQHNNAIVINQIALHTPITPSTLGQHACTTGRPARVQSRHKFGIQKNSFFKAGCGVPDCGAEGEHTVS